MTIASTTRRIDAVGNGNVDTYPYTFKIFDETDLRVTVADTDGVETELTLSTHYTVDGVGDVGGGNIYLVDGDFDWIDADGDLVTGYAITIRRVRQLKQETDVRNQGSNYREDVEDQFDKQVMIDQQQQDEIDRSAKLPETIDPADVDMTLPIPAADKVIGWNDAETGLENKTLALTETQYSGTISAGLDASKAASPTTDDIYVATDTKIVYVCFSAGTWTVISTLSGTDASKAASPKAGQTYIATDTGKVYRCFVAGTWTTALTFSNAVTMSGASIIHALGASVASAATTNIWANDGDTIHITGSTGPITSFGTAPQAGAKKTVVFDSTPTITHNPTSLILPGGASIVVAAGDVAVVFAETTANMRVISYVKANGQPVISTAGGLLGGARNLLVTCSSVTALTVTADEMILEDTNNNKVTIRSVSEVVTITTSGASGLVSSLSEAANTIYRVWIARKSSDGTVNGFLSTTADFATFLTQLPAGYDQAALVSTVGNNNSSNLIPFRQTGRTYCFTAWPIIASGNVGTSWVSIDLTPSTLTFFVDPSLSDFCFGSIGYNAGSHGITNDNSVANSTTLAPNKFYSSGDDQLWNWALNIITADTLYWFGNNAGSTVYLHGFEINKL